MIGIEQLKGLLQLALCGMLLKIVRRLATLCRALCKEAKAQRWMLEVKSSCVVWFTLDAKCF